MKSSSNTNPNSRLSVINHDGTAEIIFRQNIQESAQSLPDGTEAALYTWDEYRLERPWRPMLYTDIDNNYDAWLSAAKSDEERRNPPDAVQMRADIDYLQIMQSAMYGISLMAADAESDPTVLDLSWKYYPSRWDEEKLRTLVSMQKLTASDFQSITGHSFE